MRSPLTEVLSEGARHLPPKLREVKLGQAAVEDAGGIMDFAVAKQMNGGLGHVYQFLKDDGRSEIFYKK
jgi:hypothetical protein